MRLAGSSGAGLRQVISSEALWNDVGCTAALPFVCQRESLRLGKQSKATHLGVP